MSKFFSRKFLLVIAYWLYAIGGLATGQISTATGLEALGISGGVYIIANALVEIAQAWLGTKK